MNNRHDSNLTRRRYLQAAGVTISCTAADPVIAAENPRPDYGGYLDGANGYGGSTTDLRGQEEVTIEVGAGSDGLAFSPAAVWVDPGTTIVWEWTGNGGDHNVVGDNVEFSSGDPVGEAGYTYERTFEESQIVNYYCRPHQQLGMLGAVAVGDDIETVSTGSAETGDSGLPWLSLGAGALAGLTGVAAWRLRGENDDGDRDTPSMSSPAGDETTTSPGTSEQDAIDGEDGSTGTTQPEEKTPQVRANDSEPAIPTTPSLSLSYEQFDDREPIGQGGNADVYRVTVETPDGSVPIAVKEPRMQGTLHTETVERLLEEAETWRKLDDHDHIVELLDYGSDPVPWLAMEYMDGGHLGERGPQMDFGQALWTAIAITEGVNHAHHRGVVHLDLKPQNVLFRQVADAWDVPKVADWGLSKHLLEHSKSIEGYSPQYAAPEQFDDSFGEADHRTDIYQLGAVFYELFTDEPVFEGQTGRVISKVLTEDPTPPSELADVPKALDEILLQALAKEKTDRYESVLYLRDDLQEVLDGL